MKNSIIVLLIIFNIFILMIESYSKKVEWVQNEPKKRRSRELFSKRSRLNRELFGKRSDSYLIESDFISPKSIIFRINKSKN